MLSAYQPVEFVDYRGNLYPLESLIKRLSLEYIRELQRAAPRSGQEAWDLVDKRWPELAEIIADAVMHVSLEAERDRTRERIAKVKRDQKMRNRYLGGTLPFGWRATGDGELVADLDQQRAIEQIRKLKAQGLSLRAVADYMVAAGVQISHVGVKNALNASPAA